MKPNHLITLLVSALVSVFRAPEREEMYNSYSESLYPEGRLPNRLAEAAFPVRFLLAKKGTGAASIGLCGATDEPIGPCFDMPSIGDKATVLALGAGVGTRTMIASKALAEDVRVFTTASGKITDTAVNNCWLVGKTAEPATANGSEVNIIPCFPVKQTV